MFPIKTWEIPEVQLGYEIGHMRIVEMQGLLLIMALTVSLRQPNEWGERNDMEAKEMVEKYHLGLTGVHNARQLGGYGTIDGRTVKQGLLIRTASLSGAVSNDLYSLKNTYKVTAIIDFRTTAEVEAGPDPDIDGVTKIHLNPDGDGNHSGTRIKNRDPGELLIEKVKSMGDVNAAISSNYKKLVNDTIALTAYREFFQTVLNHESGALLWHCSSGKDRTGIAAALLLSALGVDRETIIQDYILSNDYSASVIDYLVNLAEQKTTDAEIIRGVKLLMSVERNWIEGTFEGIEEKYGSVDNFLASAMGLSKDDINTLKDKYLESL